ncbi:MAG: hypothetical protein J6C97_04325 [Clostridia bacterium]|nr:hypothetical protein [Clostridia bacterium]
MQNAEIKRNLQYLKVLKTQKQNMVAEQKELEANVAQLRKNPTDKLTTDLYIFQYNKKIEVLKENISSTNKEIQRVSKELEGEDLSSLDEDDKAEYQEEIQEVTPQPEIEEEPVAEEIFVEPIKVEKQNNFKALIFSLNNPAKLILLAIVSVLSAWLLYQIDASNMVSMVATYTKFTVFAFLLVGAFSLLILSFYLYKDIDVKPFGRFSDYFILYLFVLTIITAILTAVEFTIFKTLIVVCLAIYSLLYFVLRLVLFNKNIKENVSSKPRLIKYYYALFSKHSVAIISLIAIVAICALYVLISYRIIPKWLDGRPNFFNSKLWIIIDFVLVAITLVYGLGFSIVRIKENDLKIIDLGCLISQIISLEFFFLAVIRYSQIVGIFSYVFFALLFITSTAISIFRIINYDKNEIQINS